MKPYTVEEAASVIRELQHELTGMRMKAETDQGYIDRKRAVIGVLQGALERIAKPQPSEVEDPSDGTLFEMCSMCAETHDEHERNCLIGIARDALAKANAIATARPYPEDSDLMERT